MLAGAQLEINKYFAFEQAQGAPALAHAAATRIVTLEQCASRPTVILDDTLHDVIASAIDFHVGRQEFVQAFSLLRLLYNSLIHRKEQGLVPKLKADCLEKLMEKFGGGQTKVEDPPSTMVALASALIANDSDKALERIGGRLQQVAEGRARIRLPRLPASVDRVHGPRRSTPHFEGIPPDHRGPSRGPRSKLQCCCSASKAATTWKAWSTAAQGDRRLDAEERGPVAHSQAHLRRCETKAFARDQRRPGPRHRQPPAYVQGAGRLHRQPLQWRAQQAPQQEQEWSAEVALNCSKRFARIRS